MNTSSFAQTLASHWVIFTLLGAVVMVIIGLAFSNKDERVKDPISMVILLLAGLLLLCLLGGSSRKK